jgi:hypothetical protein
MELGTAATGFHVTRLTEASFIVSTPTAGTRAGVHLFAIGKVVRRESPGADSAGARGIYRSIYYF